MKAMMILVVVAGTVQGASLGPDQSVQVREIEFSSMEACQTAAVKMTDAGRRAEQYSRTFEVDSTTGQVLVPGPVIIAECVGA